MSTPTYCFGDVGTVTATTIGTVGPVSYLWSTGATTSTISGLSADTYSVTITDSLGCTSTSSAVVADNCNTACFVFTSSTPATCEENNGTATVTGGNMLLGYNILWSNGDTTQTISG
ncbi:MAG: hypothetical protein R2728_03975 [Chitinophagales bacterium]